MKKSLVVIALSAFWLASFPLTAESAWPEKPIKVVVPFKAGGNTDALARTVQGIAEKQHILSMPMNVLNVGGHYSIGARKVLETKPDGTTFMLMHSALLSAQASGVLDFGYKDFDAVAATGQFCQIPTVREDSGFDSLMALMDAAKAKPNQVVFGVNLGGNNHMAALALQNAVPGAAFRFVQIGGGAANFAALTGGHTQVAIFTGGEYSNYRASGLHALAYMGEQRLGNLPDLPTAAEAGLNVTYCITNFWFAPKGTSAQAVDGFANMLQKVMDTDAMQESLKATFTAPVFLRGEALRKALDSEYAAIEPIAKMAKSAKK